MSQPTALSVAGLMPVPLRDRLGARDSGIWMRELRFEPADRVFVQAPSGTGKTTLVHMLYGMRSDYQGEMHWQNRKLSGMDVETIAQLRRTTVSVIFQDMRLFPALSAWENLEIKRALTDTVAQERVRDWLDMLGMADRADRPASTLSYGEQQRVAIIRSLLQPFSWLLMDEPFSHLDAANTRKAAALVDTVIRERNAAFMIADLDENNYFSYTKMLQL